MSLAELEAQLPSTRTLWPTWALRSSLVFSSTALPAPVCTKNLPSFWERQPCSFVSLPDISLAEAPFLEWCLPCDAVLSVASVVLVEGVGVACGVFLVSSVRVEVEDDGDVELCAASIETEKHNAAAVVISFFMRFCLLVDRQNLPTLSQMRC